MLRRIRQLTIIALLVILIAGFLIPESARIPVDGATRKDWNPKSFWYEPWGQSGVHKGIDIFAAHGTPVVSAVPGVVVFRGQLGIGGNVVAVLGPKWRVHYYAHLAEPPAAPLLVAPGEPIGAVGTSGNAAGKAPHLHYAVLSVIPLPWRFSTATQGWKRIFFLNPAEVIGGNG
jgi:murein DD-endopeptidase MepM/ murein hydrolase activator NlpD